MNRDWICILSLYSGFASSLPKAIDVVVAGIIEVVGDFPTIVEMLSLYLMGTARLLTALSHLRCRSVQFQL
jgi:hypothetical protein